MLYLQIAYKEKALNAIYANYLMVQLISKLKSKKTIITSIIKAELLVLSNATK
jgi:hypothetical protein